MGRWGHSILAISASQSKFMHIHVYIIEFITGHMVYNLAYTYLNLTDNNHQCALKV